MESSKLLLQIFLLGEFRVVTRARDLDSHAWRLLRAQQLVKMLALAPQHRLTVDVILETLWHGHAPQAARHSLHQAISVTRALLSATQTDRASFLLWENDWIVLCRNDQVWTDVEAFQTAAETARRTRTMEAYQAALSFYQGELLPDDRYAEWVLRQREALRELALSLSVELAALYERAYQETDARTLLERVVADDPLREDAHRALLRLYLRNGQRHKALRLFETLRANLQRELNVEPEAATQQIYARVRTQHARAPNPALPPLPLTSFIGREQERAAIEQLLQKARLITLTGPAGCGKTRLALECAHTAALDNPVYWIELAPLTDPALLPNVIANRLGIQEQGPGAIEPRILAFLQNDAGLLVLDNCEHLFPVVARLTKMLLEQCGGLRILATSRERLRVAGESVWQVGALKYPRAAELIDDDTQRPYAAVRLFIERAQTLAPTLELAPENAALIAAICRQLEGIPLALELAAARANVLSVQQIQAALDDALQILAYGERTQLPRHQSLRAALNWSFALLPDAEQKLWQRLAVFRGDFSLEAAAVVCKRPAEPPILELVTALVDKSIVQAKSARGEMRYRLLETVRQFGLEKLQAAGELDAQRVKHYEYFCTLTEQADRGLGGAEQLHWLTRLDAAIENLRAALEWSKTFPDQTLRKTNPHSARARWWEMARCVGRKAILGKQWCCVNKGLKLPK
ncbi:MAG: hypothetical protein HY741_22115 [Chloroflexi bacterium]|nr:hypothetical protein [Chloroflexota bacterium]